MLRMLMVLTVEDDATRPQPCTCPVIRIASLVYKRINVVCINQRCPTAAVAAVCSFCGQVSPGHNLRVELACCRFTHITAYEAMVCLPACNPFVRMIVQDVNQLNVGAHVTNDGALV